MYLCSCRVEAKYMKTFILTWNCLRLLRHRFRTSCICRGFPFASRFRLVNCRPSGCNYRQSRLAHSCNRCLCSSWSRQDHLGPSSEPWLFRELVAIACHYGQVCCRLARLRPYWLLQHRPSPTTLFLCCLECLSVGNLPWYDLLHHATVFEELAVFRQVEDLVLGFRWEVELISDWRLFKFEISQQCFHHFQFCLSNESSQASKYILEYAKISKDRGNCWPLLRLQKRRIYQSLALIWWSFKKASGWTKTVDCTPEMSLCFRECMLTREEKLNQISPINQRAVVRGASDAVTHIQARADHRLTRIDNSFKNRSKR